MSDLFARFWSLVNVGDQRECWTWLGTRDACGYGVPDAALQIAFGEPSAHRMALALLRPKPAGDFEAIHSCDTPPCCNPRHLRWGSAIENTEDKRIAAWATQALLDRSSSLPISPRDHRGELVAILVPDARTPGVFRRGLVRVDRETVVAVRSDFVSGVPIREIAAKYGLTQSHTDSIAKRRIWKNIAHRPEPPG